MLGFCLAWVCKEQETLGSSAWNGTSILKSLFLRLRGHHGREGRRHGRAWGNEWPQETVSSRPSQIRGGTHRACNSSIRTYTSSFWSVSPYTYCFPSLSQTIMKYTPSFQSLANGIRAYNKLWIHTCHVENGSLSTLARIFFCCIISHEWI